MVVSRTPTAVCRRPAAPDDSAAAGEPAAAEGWLDADARLARARELAWRSLNRRDRTRAELRGHLESKGIPTKESDAIIGELTEGGYLDDAAFARRFAEDRRRLDAWGRGRIEHRLRRLGVAPRHIEAALAGQESGEELEAALELLRRRFPVSPAEERGRARALGLLLRRGYASEIAYEALRRHRGEAAG